MKKCSFKQSVPLREFNVMKKAPRIEGMKVATVRKESKNFNQPMAHVYYKLKKQDQ